VNCKILWRAACRFTNGRGGWSSCRSCRRRQQGRYRDSNCGDGWA